MTLDPMIEAEYERDRADYDGPYDDYDDDPGYDDPDYYYGE